MEAFPDARDYIAESPAARPIAERVDGGRASDGRVEVFDVYWKDGRPVHSNRVVCGAPSTQTPSLEKPFASVVANPPWYVPASIARTEILPRDTDGRIPSPMTIDFTP